MPAAAKRDEGEREKERERKSAAAKQTVIGKLLTGLEGHFVVSTLKLVLTPVLVSAAFIILLSNLSI